MITTPVRWYSPSPRVLIKKDDITPIDQHDNNIGYLALHYFLSEFMSLHSNTQTRERTTWECVHSDFIRARARSSQEDFFMPMRKVLVFSKKMLCLIVGRERRRERRWWASGYQVSPNTVSCVLTHIFTPIHISISTHPTPSHLHPRLHTHMHIPTPTHLHTHTSPHPLSMNLYFLTGDMEVVCKNGVTLVLTLQLSYNTEIRL